MSIAEAAIDAAAIMAMPEFRRLKQVLIDTTGMQFFEDRDSALADRAEGRRRALGCTRHDYFRRVLDPHDGEEFAALVDDLTVGESYFFRYPAQFEALRSVVLPDRLSARAPERRLRLWSAGCSSGAEPFSIGILLRDAAAETAGWDISILATDINRKALDSARAGLFSNWDLRTANDALKSRCFDAHGRTWSLRPDFRRGVEFRHQNLVSEIDGFAAQNAGTFDVIFCRNVMIYFAPALMRRLVRGFERCLAEGGWLFVGHAEPYFEIANVLTPVVVDGTTLYRKSAGAAFATGAAFAAFAAGATGAAFAAGATDTAGPDGPPAGPLPITYEPFEFPPLPAPPPLDPPRAPDAAAGPAPPSEPRQRMRVRAGNGEWRGALEASEEAIRREPLDPGLHFTQALISEHLGASGRAEDAFGRVVYLDRRLALAHYHLGRCQARRGDDKAALKSFANALRLIETRDGGEAIALGEGLTVDELRELTLLQMRSLERR
jgi:chemotaxis protein methyltransferase CheR